MRKDEQGTILVEFIGSFLLFVLLLASILSLVNIVTVQARIHYALTQTANTLSMYGYVLNVTGMDNSLMNIAGGAAKVQSEIDAQMDDINEVFSHINELDLDGVQKSSASAGDRFARWADNTRENPKETLQLIAQYGLHNGESALLEQLLRPLMIHYLSNGSMSGEEYLRSMRINDSLEFYDFAIFGPASTGGGLLADSVLLDENGQVRLTVQYEVDYSFLGLPLPFEPKLKITQSAMTGMWLGGSGEGYNG